jgi:hypothetical protein
MNEVSSKPGEALRAKYKLPEKLKKLSAFDFTRNYFFNYKTIQLFIDINDCFSCRDLWNKK